LSRAKATHISGRTSPSDPLKFGTYPLVQVLGNVRRAADLADALITAGYGL
jgi:hypothetical protein